MAIELSSGTGTFPQLIGAKLRGARQRARAAFHPDGLRTHARTPAGLHFAS